MAMYISHKNTNLIFLFLLISTFSINALLPNSGDSISQFFSGLESSNCSTIDIALIGYILHISEQRSRATLTAQSAQLDLFEQQCDMIDFITTTRRNPARALKKSVTFDADVISSAEKCFTEYQQCMRNYALTIEAACNNTLLSAPACNMLQKLRAHSREHMLEILTDMREQMEQIIAHGKALYDLTIKTSSRGGVISLFEEASTLVNHVITTVLPQALMYSFVRLDEGYCASTYTGLMALKTYLAMGNILWNSIETARAELYHAYLNEWRLRYTHSITDDEYAQARKLLSQYDIELDALPARL